MRELNNVEAQEINGAGTGNILHNFATWNSWIKRWV